MRANLYVNIINKSIAMLVFEDYFNVSHFYTLIDFINLIRKYNEKHFLLSNYCCCNERERIIFNRNRVIIDRVISNRI